MNMKSLIWFNFSKWNSIIIYYQAIMFLIFPLDLKNPKLDQFDLCLEWTLNNTVCSSQIMHKIQISHNFIIAYKPSLSYMYIVRGEIYVKFSYWANDSLVTNFVVRLINTYDLGWRIIENGVKLSQSLKKRWVARSVCIRKTIGNTDTKSSHYFMCAIVLVLFKKPFIFIILIHTSTW